MSKRLPALVALTFMTWGQASAVPVTWTIDGLGATPYGSFVFDASTSAYSSVSVTQYFLTAGSNVTFTSVSGGSDSSHLNLTNSPYLLNIFFLDPLTDAGGMIGFMSFNGRQTVFGNLWSIVPDGGIVTAPSTVPEPGSLMLLGVGLVGLGLARRRKTIA